MRGYAFTLAVGSALFVAACGQPSGASEAADKIAMAASDGGAKTEAAAPASVDFTAAQSGVYTTDAKHHHLIFKYGHVGYSTSYVRWRDWTGELNWNAENPEASSIGVTINVSGADSGVDEFDDHLRGENFFDAAKYPTITFRSTALTRTGSNTGKMTGDLTIKGVTKPATLDVVINKAAYEERGNMYKLGFSAKGAVNRSEFGMDYAIPYVDDEVKLIIEAEFLSPKAAE